MVLPECCPWNEEAPLAKVSLTPRLVDELKVKEGRTRTLYLDTHPNAPKGFGLRVTAKGAKTFVLIRTSKQKGRRPWVTIAPGQGSGLEAARRAAELRGGEISLGRDPNAEARAERQKVRAEALQKRVRSTEWTVLDMVRAHVEARRPGLAEETEYRYQRHIEAHLVGSAFGQMPAREAVRDDVRKFISNISRTTAAQAVNVLQLVTAAFRWALDEEQVVTTLEGRRVVVTRIDRDPTRRVLQDLPQVSAARRARERYLSDEEIALLWRSIDGAKPHVSAFVRIILLNGTRSTETYKARREHFNLDSPEPTWFIPAEHRKGRAQGPGARRSIVIPLAPLSVRVLREAIAASSKRGGVFDHRYPVRMNRDAPAIPDVTVHDLRRSCSTGLQRLGCPPHVISVVLGHAREEGATQVDGVYMHDRRVSEHRHWLGLWADHVAKLVGA